MSYHGQKKLEAEIEAIASNATDGDSPCDKPLTAAVIKRSKRWLEWMVDVALTTELGWRVPAAMERTCDNEFCFLWEFGESSLHIVVGDSVTFFAFDGHPLWGDGTHGDATDAEVLKLLWEELWLKKSAS